MASWYVTREVRGETKRYEAADYYAALKCLHQFDKLAGRDSDARLWGEESGRSIDSTEEARRDLAREEELRRQHNEKLRPAAFRSSIQTFSVFVLLWGILFGALSFFISDLSVGRLLLGSIVLFFGAIGMAILDYRKFYRDNRHTGFLD